MRLRLFLRRFLGTVLGLVFASIFIDTFWQAADAWFPAPDPVDSTDAAMRAVIVMGMPVAGKILIAFGWFASAFVGAYAGLRIAQWRPAGWIAVVPLAMFAIWTMTQLAQPLWLQIASLMLPLLGAWLVERHYHRARRGDPLIN